MHKNQQEVCNSVELNYSDYFGVELTHILLIQS